MGCGESKIKPIKPINTECPICYEDIDKGIELDCGHCYDRFCIQKASINYIFKNEEQKCPVCRTKISINNLKEIFNSWVIPFISPIDWTQNNTVILNKKLCVNKIETIFYNNYLNIYIPIFKHNNIPKPLFFHHNESIYLSLSPYIGLNKIFPLSLESITNDSHHILLKKIISNSDINKDLIDFELFDKNRIIFHIKNIEQIVVYDELDGTMTKGLVLKERPCNVLYRTYIINKYYIVNELYSIYYK